VIVCDDDPVTRLLTAQMLRERRHAVTEAATAQAALAAWQRQRMHALITDLNMPGMTGREQIGEIRRTEPGTGMRTLVIVCSGSAPPAPATNRSTTMPTCASRCRQACSCERWPSTAC
jgi:two-component system chemotaxis response regulator CheY